MRVVRLRSLPTSWDDKFVSQLASLFGTVKRVLSKSKNSKRIVLVTFSNSSQAKSFYEYMIASKANAKLKQEKAKRIRIL